MPTSGFQHASAQHDDVALEMRLHDSHFDDSLLALSSLVLYCGISWELHELFISSFRRCEFRLKAN